jgi:serine/threonine protein kinase
MDDQFIGQEINGYKITKKLSDEAEINTGIVYKAVDVVGRAVAIKLLVPSYTRLDEITERRYDREIKILQALRHRNIARFLGTGLWTLNGTLSTSIRYFITTYKPLTLSKYLAEYSYDESAIFSIFSGIAAGIDYAHKKGILHRDLKPQNILLDNNLTPCITDFGLGVLMHSSTNAITGVGLGTSPYMAPEVWQTGAEKASDIYALGIMFYLALEGKLPIERDSHYEYMYAHIDGDIDEPKKITREYGSDMTNVVLTALALESRERYQCATDFIEDAITVAPEIINTTSPSGWWNKFKFHWPNFSDYVIPVLSLIAAIVFGYLQLVKPSMADDTPISDRRTAIVSTSTRTLGPSITFDPRTETMWPTDTRGPEVGKIPTIEATTSSIPLLQTITVLLGPTDIPVNDDGEEETTPERTAVTIVRLPTIPPVRATIEATDVHIDVDVGVTILPPTLVLTPVPPPPATTTRPPSNTPRPPTTSVQELDSDNDGYLNSADLCPYQGVVANGDPSRGGYGVNSSGCPDVNACGVVRDNERQAGLARLNSSEIRTECRNVGRQRGEDVCQQAADAGQAMWDNDCSTRCERTMAACTVGEYETAIRRELE